jgi:hypothetical protein
MAVRRLWLHMKPAKFKLLCDQILVPLMVDAVHTELKDMNETVDVMARALARIEERLDEFGASNLDDE